VNRRSCQPGVAAAVLGVAVVASLGAATQASPVSLAPVERMAEVTTLDRQAVARWLSQFSDVVRLTRHRISAGPTIVAAIIPTRGFAALWLVRHASVSIDTTDTRPPAAPMRPALCDLPPPASVIC